MGALGRLPRSAGDRSAATGRARRSTGGDRVGRRSLLNRDSNGALSSNGGLSNVGHPLHWRGALATPELVSGQGRLGGSLLPTVAVPFDFAEVKIQVVAFCANYATTC